MKKINKWGFYVGRANLRHTNNIFLACSNDQGLTWRYFSRNSYKSLQTAQDAMNAYMRSQYKQNDKRDNF
jgi:hypothetical protein